MIGKKTPEICYRLGYAYHSLGVQDYNENRYSEAINSFSLAIKYYPHEANFYVDRATTN